ncbi:protein-lysine N-methyltransferase SMYD4-like [Babylonia areolata]|uniref:protein-lysine N-methyltransferase SMYD4-like n=1 Tax=Babylonia areolata TaxID=304850 RepID=UPI003FD44735
MSDVSEAKAAAATNGTADPYQNGTPKPSSKVKTTCETPSTGKMMEADTDVMKVAAEKLPEMIQQLSEALKNCSASSVSSEEKCTYLRRRSQCHFRLQDYSAALTDAEAAMVENSRDLAPYVAAGQACIAMGRYKEALQFFKAGLQIDPNSKILVEQLRQLQTTILQQSETAVESEPSYNALDFCTQDPYPGDDVQLRLEREILETKYKVSDALLKGQDGVKANQAEAVKYLKLAYEAISTGRYQESVEQCTKAINAEPTNVFARKFRAQLLFDNNDLVEALKDLWAIPKGSRTPDVWNMGGKILHSLWLPVLAEFWLRKATVTSGKKDVEAAILFQKIRVKRLYDPLTKDFPVMVDFTQYGRAIVATEDVKADEVLLKDLSLVHAQTLPSLHVPACCQCTASLITARDYFGDEYEVLGERARKVVDRHWPDMTPVWCPRCRREMYCSELCRDTAWDQYHRVLCPSVNLAASKLYDLRDNNGYGENAQGKRVELWGGHYSPFVLAKVWAAILCHVDRLMEEAGNKGGEPTVEQWATAKAPYRRFIAFGTTPATDRMPEMLTVFQEIFDSTPLQGLRYPITEAEFKGRYYQAACNLQCFSAAINPFHRFLNSLQNDVEGFSVLRHLDESKIPEPYFAGMFPVHACLNHSCDNNAEVSNGELDGHFGVQVTAKRDIKKGEEIFITYIDTALPRMLRRAWLFKSFNFWCRCRRCQFEGDQPTVCTQCGAKSEPGKKFPTCGKCHKAWYCSTQCQRQAWGKGHKVICLTKHSIVANPQDYEV